MNTLKRIEANRLNARKSTGPRTAGGKPANCLNAIKHGILAIDPVILGEDPARFDALRASHFDCFQPAHPDEVVLLASMVRAAWSLERSSNVETAVWAAAMDRQKDQANPPDRTDSFLADSLAQIQRRVDSAQRNYRLSLKLLLKIQAARRKAAKTAPNPIHNSNPLSHLQAKLALFLQIPASAEKAPPDPAPPATSPIATTTAPN